MFVEKPSFTSFHVAEGGFEGTECGAFRETPRAQATLQAIELEGVRLAAAYHRCQWCPFFFWWFLRSPRMSKVGKLFCSGGGCVKDAKAKTFAVSPSQIVERCQASNGCAKKDRWEISEMPWAEWRGKDLKLYWVSDMFSIWWPKSIHQNDGLRWVLPKNEDSPW